MVEQKAAASAVSAGEADAAIVINKNYVACVKWLKENYEKENNNCITCSWCNYNIYVTWHDISRILY